MVCLFSRLPDGEVVPVPVREVESPGAAHFDDLTDCLVVLLEARIKLVEIGDVEQSGRFVGGHFR